MFLFHGCMQNTAYIIVHVLMQNICCNHAQMHVSVHSLWWMQSVCSQHALRECCVPAKIWPFPRAARQIPFGFPAQPICTFCQAPNCICPQHSLLAQFAHECGRHLNGEKDFDIKFFYWRKFFDQKMNKINWKGSVLGIKITFLAIYSIFLLQIMF